MDNDNDELDYVSSAVSPFEDEKDKPSVDAPDEKTLVAVQRVLDSQIKLYHTISGMKRFDSKKFTADQREEMCEQYTQLLGNLTLLITNAIDEIRSKTNG